MKLPPHNGTKTSKAAARAIEQHAPTIRGCVYRMLRAFQLRGLTREELETKTGYSGNTVRPRTRELLEAGLIYERGTRRTRAGRMAAVLFAR